MSDDHDPKPEPTPEGTPPPEKPSSPFDCLMVSPEEAERMEKMREAARPPEEPESPVKDEGDILPEQVEKICEAIDRLGRRGLNLRAVGALLHDAHPSVPKKHIKIVLEGLRELPALYGKPRKAKE